MIWMAAVAAIASASGALAFLVARRILRKARATPSDSAKAAETRDPFSASPTPKEPPPDSPGAPRTVGRSNAPNPLPFANVSFEYIVLSRSGEPIAEGEFNHHLLLGAAGGKLSREARALLQHDVLTLSCLKRVFVGGRPKREPEEFALCRRLANRAQTTIGPTDRDIILKERGAYYLRNNGPPEPGVAHLELTVRAAETVRSMRKGLVVDRAAMLVWGEFAWESQWARKGGFSAREHFKIEMGASRAGVGITTRGLVKFGLPELRIDGLPQDMTGIAAASLSSIALDLAHAEGPLDPARSLPVPAVRGRIGFVYERMPPKSEYPAGFFRLLGGVDNEAPSLLGLLEVLGRLRQYYETGTDFWRADQVDRRKLRRLAQDALSRFKAKFQTRQARADRVFLVRWQPEGSVPDSPETWLSLHAWNGSTLRGAVAVGPLHGEAQLGQLASIEERDVLDWMILQGGDVEDGGFALRLSEEASERGE
ncbi:MAG: hypothetical protein NTW86_13500 [Candidatus Sumerlaeota bacterium]|nr:hypothetical protein [Candidatus Sumerlaeota bacterium]